MCACDVCDVCDVCDAYACNSLEERETDCDRKIRGEGEVTACLMREGMRGLMIQRDTNNGREKEIKERRENERMGGRGRGRKNGKEREREITSMVVGYYLLQLLASIHLC